MRKLVIAGVLVLASLVASQAGAGPITFSYVNPNGASATATFEVVGGNLQVTLTNTGSVILSGGQNPKAIESVNALSAVFFNTSFSGTLTPESIALGPGSTVVQYTGSTLIEDLGDGWRYDTLTSPQYGATRVIAGAGYTVLPYSGPAFSNFGDTPPDQNLDGSDWLIAPSGYQAGSGTGQFGNSTNPVVVNSVVFTLKGIPAGFDPATQITDVTFQYGTALTDQHGAAVPEPTTLVLIGGGLTALALRRRRQG